MCECGLKVPEMSGDYRKPTEQPSSHEAMLAFLKVVMPTIKRYSPDYAIMGERIISEAEKKS